MKHGSNNRRQRSRGGGSRRGNQQRTQVFDSNGPDVRIRGTAHQVTEKYLALAKDAAAAGDIILAESYSQHAEHYQRIINSFEEDMQEVKARQQQKEEASQENADSEAPGEDEKAKPRRKPASKAKKEEDLGLPASIIGAGSEGEVLAE